MKILKTVAEQRQDKLIKDWKKSLKKPKKSRKTKNKIYDTSNLRGRPYIVFLNSPYWDMVRKRVLKRDSYKCIICKSEEKLQIHHNTYKHHFQEHKHLKDLMTLCAKCHKEHHYAQS